MRPARNPTRPKPPEAAGASPPRPDELLDERPEPPHAESLTAVAAEALRVGIAPAEPDLEEVPHDEKLRSGDPDVDPLANALYGDEIPGGGMPTPDQSSVDDIGRAYGLEDLDSGELYLGEDPIRRRDFHRAELDARFDARSRKEAIPGDGEAPAQELDDRGEAMETLPIRMFKGEHLTIAAQMPGIIPEGITIEATAEGKLILDASLPWEAAQENSGELKGDKEVLIDEWAVGPFHRELELPQPVDAEHAKVTFGNGVLVVALPLAEKMHPAVFKVDRIGPGRGAGAPK